MGLELVCGTGIDTTFAKDQWKDTSIVCEIVTVDFPDVPEEPKAQKQQPLQMPFTPPAVQLALF
ncbi:MULTISPECIES: hypothetical protein [Rhizobium/Agrobacterium group]|uniref:hypothetical protein n=1 Tax=Rhizobium/Agrobacterium group TaxID=227290 RepID=UPI000B404330|nr:MULTISPECIES: hypothetical protein [Rhizobium/Agrobacterium group]MCF1485572.1 hypothetical protein [Allorhizobium ampelinum]NSZ46262.1 hypothetical protein [Agrobacterium vitis]NTA25358.1 hypothetical protein [Allorhizobium ampelinum]OVE97149.1 hypothetical protein B7W85_02465 [Allorhizobium ampelinum]